MMDIMQAIEERHSVRRFSDEPLTREEIGHLRAMVYQANADSGLDIQLIDDQPDAFKGVRAKYGRFSNVKAFISVVGQRDDPELEFKCGYHVEPIVLEATRIGVDSCWVAVTFSRGFVRKTIDKGEKLVCVIALGHGIDHGTPHESKLLLELASYKDPIQPWFEAGMRAAMLAPTGNNHQKFHITCVDENHAHAEAKHGYLTDLDLGIVKRHFEYGAGVENFSWV